MSRTNASIAPVSVTLAGVFILFDTRPKPAIILDKGPERAFLNGSSFIYQLNKNYVKTF